MDLTRLGELAQLIQQRNALEVAIARMTGRPAHLGALGEFIAAEIFDIQLATSGSNKGHDGWFRSGPLAGKTTNIKWYARQEWTLDIREAALPDTFLVLAGPRRAAQADIAGTRAWHIETVYFFDAVELVARLRARSLTPGTASSVATPFWIDAEIHPQQTNRQFLLSEEQRQALALFAPPP